MAEKTETKGTKKKEEKPKKVVKKEAPKVLEKKETKKEVKEEKEKPKGKRTYKISRSKEASRMAREKSRLEKKKGKFKRQNYGKKKRVPERWRRPKGIDSGHRIDEKHKPAHPRVGYMTPTKVKGLHPTGYEPVRVFNLDGLEGLDAKKQAIIIASSVGKKKRLEINKAAQAKNIQILNFKE
jgi:large subunit ribosomal protein L32e